MARRVFIAGGYFHATDLRYLPGASELSFDALRPGLSVIEDVEAFFAAASQAELAIFVTHGGKLIKFFDLHGERQCVKEFFANPNIRKVMWTVDAHHLWPVEVRYQKYFDRVYVADSSVIKHFEPGKAAWLPCYYRYLSIDDLIATVKERRPPERNLAFPHHAYSVGDRQEISRSIQEICDRRGLTSVFGEVGGEDAYLQVMLTTDVCLNVSLLSEVNLRTFEALALNRVLLADWAPDYLRVSTDWSSTVFFNRDLSGFEARLDQALSIAPESVNTMPSIANGHMIIHRYLEIINRELGTRYRMDAAFSGASSRPPQAVPGCLPPGSKLSVVDRLRGFFG